jgi:hypothetical protein
MGSRCSLAAKLEKKSNKLKDPSFTSHARQLKKLFLLANVMSFW